MQTLTLAVDSATAVVAGLLLIAFVLLVICLVLLLRVRQGLGELKSGVDTFFEGDTAKGVAVEGPMGVNELSASLSQMARTTNARLVTAVSQRRELEAVLTSMVEGVLAVDREERFLRLNHAAAALLDLEPGKVVGRSIQEVVRNAALQEFVARTLASATPVQGEVLLRSESAWREGGGDVGTGERSLQAQGVKLRDASGQEIGALIVLHDITRMRRLENMRREFVANVSHEIKTPIAAIKAAVETVLQPGEQDPEDTRRFLEMISRQAERLHALVEDVLTLARIEQDVERSTIELKQAHVIDVLLPAVEACQLQADGKQITLELACDETLMANMHPALLEHAVINLINNAVKYSPENTKIIVSAYVVAHGQPDGSPMKFAAHAEEGVVISTPRTVVISVLDQGSGIEAEYLPRVFERFFRPDKARNRSQGGTGLGLAIVKHTVQAHGGRVSVDSAVGKGSNFRIHLPLG